MKHFIYSLTLFFLVAIFNRAQAQNKLIPYELPWDDDAETFISRAHLLDTPAGKDGFIQSRDGHFYDGSGERFRILGVNTCFAGNFPTHEQADKLAGRMAKFGINAVRFHHMDTLRAPRGIWKEGPAAKQELDPENLDRLDYFIAALKKRGIYSNLNLKVAREFVEADGLPMADQLPNHSKGVDYYVDRMVDLQNDFARDLLTHINPYTGNAYINEPAIAMVELNNENGLLFSWRKGDLDGLPEIYQNPLQEMWNLYLLHKYKNTESIKNAWQSEMNVQEKPILENYAESMRLNQIGSAKANINYAQGETLIEVENPGELNWHVQWIVPMPPVKKGVLYEGEVTIKSSNERALQFGVRMDKSPWDFIAPTKTFESGSEWQTFEFSFIPEQSAEKVRLDISNLGEAGDSLWIKDLQVSQTGFTGLPDGQSLEEKNIACLWRDDYPKRSIEARRDWIDFLVERESRYHQEMYDYLRDDLKVRSMITGTQLMFGTALSQLGHDFIDIHGYFHHPHFPGDAWDMNNWYVNNVSIVEESDNVLAERMRARIAGYPYTVSEYNHPAPNPYSSEVAPVIAAYGAFQDWDGIFLFAYSHNNNYEEKSIDSFFDIAGHTPKMMTMPIAANMFLRGDISTAQETVTVNITRDEYQEKLVETSGNPWWIPFDESEVSPIASYLHQTQLEFGKAMSTTKVPDVDEDISARLSDTGELEWLYRSEGESHVVIKSRRTKGYIGFVDHTTVELGDRFYLAIGETLNNWANVLVSQMDEAGKRWLITATGYTENKGMKWKNEEKTTVGSDWGEGPPLVEPVPFLLSIGELEKAPQLFALDETGARVDELSDIVIMDEDKARLELMNNNENLWFELVLP